MPLRFVQVQEISDLLRHVPKLVDELEARRSDFVDHVHAWLNRVEALLERDRLPTVSQIAAYRAMLLQAARGLQSSEISVPGRPTSRKIRDATGVFVLRRCDQILHELIAERRAVFQEAERLARQLIAFADAKGILANCASSPSHQAFLLCVQRTLSADRDLASIYLHLVALVGKYDVLIFIDREIPDTP